MKRRFATVFPLAWVVIFAAVIVAGLGAASILYVPFAAILVPYYLLKRRFVQEPTKRVVVVYWTTVAIMTFILGDLILSFYGHGIII